MKRKLTAYRFAQVILIVCIVLLMPTTVWAQETTLITFVPSSHTLHTELIGKGTITVDGVAYTKSAQIHIARHSAPVISTTPNSGWKLESVFLNGQDITGEFQSGAFAFPRMCYDAELTVVFETNGSMPQSENECNVWILLLILLFAIGIVLCVAGYRKKRKNDK